MPTVNLGWSNSKVTVSPDPVPVPAGNQTITFQVPSNLTNVKIRSLAITGNPDPNPFSVPNIAEPVTSLSVSDDNTSASHRNNPYTYDITLDVGGTNHSSTGHQITNESEDKR